VIGEVGVNPEDEKEFTAPVQENANSAWERKQEIANASVQTGHPDFDLGA